MSFWRKHALHVMYTLISKMKKHTIWLITSARLAMLMSVKGQTTSSNPKHSYHPMCYNSWQAMYCNSWSVDKGYGDPVALANQMSLCAQPHQFEASNTLLCLLKWYLRAFIFQSSFILNTSWKGCTHSFRMEMGFRQHGAATHPFDIKNVRGSYQSLQFFSKCHQFIELLRS